MSVGNPTYIKLRSGETPMNKTEENQQYPHFNTTNIKVLDSSRDRLFEITEREVRDCFKRHAADKNIKVLNGTKGTVPRIIHTLEMLLNLWDTLDERIKSRLIDDYVGEYTDYICSNRPDWMNKGRGSYRNIIPAGKVSPRIPYHEGVRAGGV